MLGCELPGHPSVRILFQEILSLSLIADGTEFRWDRHQQEGQSSCQASDRLGLRSAHGEQSQKGRRAGGPALGTRSGQGGAVEVLTMDYESRADLLGESETTHEALLQAATRHAQENVDWRERNK